MFSARSPRIVQRDEHAQNRGRELKIVEFESDF
jgi:hypothetical protein